MQSGGGVASLLLALALAGSLRSAFGLSVSATADTAAVSWLRAHRGAPQADELAELKDANPEAYGLVKALLMKRSLGLLDPRHPTASFAKAPATTDEVPAGPEAFQKIAEESGEKPKAAPLYADVPSAPVHHSWLNWKPQQSALDDDSMVKDVMGATPVAKAEGQPSEDALASASPQAVQTVQVPAEGPVAAADAKPQASMNQENSYLKGIDFGLEAPPSPPRASVEQNSYLKQFDFGSEQQTRPRAVGLSSVRRSQSSQSSSDLLASFSWDDEAPVAKEHPSQPSSATSGWENLNSKEKYNHSGYADDWHNEWGHAETTAAPAAETKPKPHNSLLDWLSPKVQRAAPTKPPAPAQQENSYLQGLHLLSN